jgi:hypothetical protein
LAASHDGESHEDGLAILASFSDRIVYRYRGVRLSNTVADVSFTRKHGVTDPQMGATTAMDETPPKGPQFPQGIDPQKLTFGRTSLAGRSARIPSTYHRSI